MKKNIQPLLITLIVCLLAIQLILSCRRAGDGDQLAILNFQISELNENNYLLKQQIYKLSATDKIKDYAQKHQLITATYSRLSSFMVAAVP